MEEKYKKLKDGTVARYVYYGCTRSRDKHCKGGYIREEELINQLINLVDQMNLNEAEIEHKYKEEVTRFNKFQKTILGLQGMQEKGKKLDIRDYAKYVLQEGSPGEKRELLGSIKSKLVFKDRQVRILGLEQFETGLLQTEK